MDHLGNSLLIEHEARRRQDAIVAAADRWAIHAEEPAEAKLREGMAHFLIGLALWLAPERSLPEIRRAAVNHLAR